MVSVIKGFHCVLMCTYILMCSQCMYIYTCNFEHMHTHTQAVVNLLNILSSYAALHEVLNQAMPATKSKQDTIPSTVFVSK